MGLGMDSKFGVGELINGAVATLIENKIAVLIYVGGLTALNIGLQLALGQVSCPLLLRIGGIARLQSVVGLGAGFAGIAAGIMVGLAQYFLWEAMLRARGCLTNDYRRRVLAYFGLAILAFLATSLAYLLLIVPGLIFAARWTMAPAYLIAEQREVPHSLSKSWDQIRGNTTPVVITHLITIGFSVGFALAFRNTVGLARLVPMQLAANSLATVNIALGVFLFGRLRGGSRGLVEVFA